MYTVLFEDGTFFKGGGPAESKWSSIPPKPITKICYFLKRKYIVMEGYDSYNHLVERATLFPGGNVILGVALMGKTDNKVIVFHYDLINPIESLKYETQYGNEWNNGPSSGWKEGKKGSNAKLTIL